MFLVRTPRTFSYCWWGSKTNPVCTCDVLRDLASFAQLKKCEKHPWRSVTFSKVAGLKLKPATLLKVKFLHGCFLGFLNCINGTKSRSASHIIID